MHLRTVQPSQPHTTPPPKKKVAYWQDFEKVAFASPGELLLYNAHATGNNTRKRLAYTETRLLTVADVCL